MTKIQAIPPVVTYALRHIVVQSPVCGAECRGIALVVIVLLVSQDTQFGCSVVVPPRPGVRDIERVFEPRAHLADAPPPAFVGWKWQKHSIAVAAFHRGIVRGSCHIRQVLVETAKATIYDCGNQRVF